LTFPFVKVYVHPRPPRFVMGKSITQRDS
jgi:hypothetical protein